MTPPNYYRVLGVAPDASPGDVRAAYARLVKRHHPDLAGDLPARLDDLRNAYQCLSDPAARAEHDRQIAERDREHTARQRRIRHRLDRYDRRHPAAAPIASNRRWRMLLLVGAVALIVVGIAAALLGAEAG